MADVDNSGQNSNEDTVAGPNPLGQGSPSQAEGSTADTAPSAPSGSMMQSGQNVDQIQSQGTAANKKAPKASSGMFTNIQKYVEKNKPQAQKMAGAVTQDFGKQAAEIRSAAQNKADQQSTLMNTNKELIGNKEQGTGAYGTAESAISNVMGGGAVSKDAAADYKRLREGELDGYQQTGLNLAEQQNRMGALSQLAQGANTEQGRRNLLGNTFKKQGEYNRGMSGLDNLITSGNKEARESLIGGVEGESEQLGTDVNRMSTDFKTAKDLQDEEKRNLAGNITSMAYDPYSGIKKTAEDRGTRVGNLDIGSMISDEDLTAMGLSRRDVANLYGVDPSAILGSSGATAKEIQRMEGLSSLLGTGYDSSQFQEFKTQDFLDEVARQKQLYETAVGEGAKSAAEKDFLKNWTGNTGFGKSALERLDKEYTTGEHARYGGYKYRTPAYMEARRKAEEQAGLDYRFGEGLKSDSGPAKRRSGSKYF